MAHEESEQQDPSHMARGARINDPIWRSTRIGVMDCSVSIGCNEGQV